MVAVLWITCFTVWTLTCDWPMVAVLWITWFTVCTQPCDWPMVCCSAPIGSHYVSRHVITYGRNHVTSSASRPGRLFACTQHHALCLLPSTLLSSSVAVIRLELPHIVTMTVFGREGNGAIGQSAGGWSCDSKLLLLVSAASRAHTGLHGNISASIFGTLVMIRLIR